MNKDISHEIEEKGFNVYNYISLDELLLTVRKDYLDILTYINVPFGVATVVLGLFSYFTSQVIFLFSFLILVYSVIFLILFVKLLKKTYHFLLITDVVFTKKGIIFGDTLYQYSESETLDAKLHYYETIFLEYLGGKSRLKEYIHSKKKELVSFKTGKNASPGFGKVLEHLSGSSGNSENGGKIVLVIIASYILYIAFLYFSYYAGYFLGLFCVKIYAFFIKILLFFKNNYELKIKNKVTDIDNDIEKMNTVYTLLDTKYKKFTEGEISNISKFTHKNFESFYTEIFSVYENKRELETLILKGKYKDFIDFKLFEKYLKKTFNKPILSMIAMLEKHLKKIPNQLKKLETLNHDEEGIMGTIKMKRMILIDNQNLLQVNINKLKKSLI